MDIPQRFVMTGTEIALIITALSALVGSIGGFVVGILNRAGIKQIHDATDGMKTELVNITRTSSLAEGRKQVTDEVAAARQEVKDNPS
jgi:hypothetical protein